MRQPPVRSRPLALAAVVLVAGVLCRGAQAADAPTAPAARVDLDIVIGALAPLGQDPVFGGVETPKGDLLVPWLLDELPADQRPRLKGKMLEARMGARLALSIAASLEVRVVRFDSPTDAAVYLDARKAASKGEDAARDPDPAVLRVLEATYEEGAGTSGHLSGYVVRKRARRNGHAHASVEEVAQIETVVVALDAADLVDVGRAELDAALSRAEVAVKDPAAARKAPPVPPLLLASLGPPLSVRVVGPGGAAVEQFAVRVSWEAGPNHYQSESAYGRNGVAYARVEGASATVEVWAPQTASGEPLPFGPATKGVDASAKDVELTLPAERAVTGVVADRDGRPVAGIRVTASPSDEGVHGIPAKDLPPGGLRHGDRPAFDAHGTSVSGADGTFRVGGLASARYRLTTADAEWFTVADVEADSGADGVRLVIEKPVAVAVTVLGPDGEPLRGALVSVNPVGGPTFSSDTVYEADAKGVARVSRLHPGSDYRVRVAPPPGRDDLAALSYERWKPTDTTARLEGSRRIDGTVKGAEAAKARVHWRSDDGREGSVFVDGEGRFTLRVPQGPIVVTAYVTGDGPDPLWLAVPTNVPLEQATVEITLVRFEKPKRLFVAISGLTAQDAVQLIDGEERQGTIGGEGHFEVPMSLVGKAVTVWVAPRDGRGLLATGVRMEEGGPPLALAPTTRIAGRFTGPAAEHREIAALVPSRIPVVGSVEADGSFSIEVPPGHYTLRAKGRAESGWVYGVAEADGGAKDVEVTLKSAGR